MSDEEYHGRKNPFTSFVVVALLLGGGWFFLQNFQISGLDGLSVRKKPISGVDLLSDPSDYDLVSHRDITAGEQISSVGGPSDLTLATRSIEPRSAAIDPQPAKRVRNLRIASWAIDDFDLDKLSSEIAGPNIVRTARQFDLIAIQSIAARPRDLVSRLVDAINKDGLQYDYVIGEPTGPTNEAQRLGFVFDTTRVLVDRSQTYTVADPTDQLKLDPLVAWFRAAQPASDNAWTFSLVNVSIDLGRAQQEVALLPNLLSSVRFDGRGEDDVVLAGVFQADDAYLLATFGVREAQAAVLDTPTDLMGKHQISNILVDGNATSEFVGRGGTFDFLRVFNLSAGDAAIVSGHLPVYAEFSASEDGNL